MERLDTLRLECHSHGVEAGGGRKPGLGVAAVIENEASRLSVAYAQDQQRRRWGGLMWQILDAPERGHTESRSAMNTLPYPNRPITVVAPFPPGHVSDLHPRLLAPHAAEILGQSVMVENWPGASGTVALPPVGSRQQRS
jgi:hypothetical protein